MYGIKLCSLLLSLLSILNIVKGSNVVETTSGKVAGVQKQSLFKDEIFYSFYSIPYAEPPIKENRFQPPKPHPGWNDILENKKEKKPCAHFNMPAKHIKNYGFSGTEDCLHLSIHTPKLPKQDVLNFPVIVFLYNERFSIAYNASKEYSPDFFMHEEVILVTVQHRLSVFGFLSFEDDLLPGNNGLRDVILALRWIKKNIHSFGGDPNKITLMGSHDGAVLVDVLLHSPKAKGLFGAAILQSGTVLNSVYFNGKARERAITLSEAIEEHATTSSYMLKRFSEVSAKKLVEHEHRCVHADDARIHQKGIIIFGPEIEHDHPDAIITEYPEKTTSDINIPIMIGYNSRESLETVERYLQKPSYLSFADKDFLFLFPYRTDYYFDISSQIYGQAIDEIKEFYFDEGYVKVSAPSEYITYLQDLLVLYPIDYAVRKYVNESNSPVYYYTFDYSGDFNIEKQGVLKEAVTIDGAWGASRGDELCYLFVCQKIRNLYKKAMEDEDSEEISVIRNMVRLWTNFAKTRNPTPSANEFQWIPASKENKECLVISDELQMKNNLHEKSITFWDQFLEKYRKLAVDGVVKDDNIKDEL
ncbi:hypothetical protein ACJJTC_006896 [Scirpophaga incertulas]